jgi:hypothetical protein
MGASKPPKAPAQAVATSDLKDAWGGAMGSIGAAGDNTIPTDVWEMFSPEMVTKTPYGYDPNATVNFGNMWSNQAPAMFAAGNQILQQGMDPQNALYDRTRGQVEQQTRAGQAARGINMTPYGASVEGGVMSDFNIDWENAQLARMMQAIQGGATAFGAGGNAIQGGQNLAASVPQNMATYAGNLQQLGINTTVPDQWKAGAYSNLFGIGSNAQNQNYGNQLEAFKAKEASEAAMWGGIGKLAGIGLAPFTGGMSLGMLAPSSLQPGSGAFG